MNLPEEVIRFRESASEFCEWVERPPPTLRPKRPRPCACCVHSCISFNMFPVGTLKTCQCTNCVLKETPLPIYKRFAALPFNYYSEVWDPLEVPGEEPVIGDLADDLMDVVHWGRHATSALRVLHCYLADPNRLVASEPKA